MLNFIRGLLVTSTVLVIIGIGLMMISLATMWPSLWGPGAVILTLGIAGLLSQTMLRSVANGRPFWLILPGLVLTATAAIGWIGATILFTGLTNTQQELMMKSLATISLWAGFWALLAYCLNWRRPPQLMVIVSGAAVASFFLATAGGSLVIWHDDMFPRFRPGSLAGWWEDNGAMVTFGLTLLGMGLLLSRMVFRADRVDELRELGFCERGVPFNCICPHCARTDQLQTGGGSAGVCRGCGLRIEVYVT